MWRKTSLSIALAAGACTHPITTPLRRDQVGSKYARISGYMQTSGAAPGGSWTEKTRGPIRHDVILDEATLATLAPSETCVDVVLRTESAHDEPLDQYRPSFEIDGQAARGVIEDERVSVYDYDYTGEREVASIEGVAADQYLGMTITQPAEKVFRVIERHGRVCAGRAAGREIKLAIVHPSWDVAAYHYRLDFAWQLE